MSDKDFLVSMFTKLGEENFKRLVTLTSLNCISELGLGTSENCKQKGICDNSMCIDCIIRVIKDLSSNTHTSFFRFLNK